MRSTFCVLPSLLAGLLAIEAVAHPGDSNQLTAAATDVRNAWRINDGETRSTFIFEDASHKTGVLVNVESVIPSGESVTVRASGIPDYRVTVDQDLLDRLAAQPPGDFPGGIPLSVGEVVAFGENIGFAKSPVGENCTLTGGSGFWPPGPDCPVDTHKSKRFTTQPQPNGGEACETSVAAIGYLVNGASVYNWWDARVDREIWQRSAPVFEGFDVDICGGHAAKGDYHHHFYTSCLADLVQDTGQGHSPVYGFADDGYPIHGPWYAAGTLAMSSWVIRDYDDPGVGCADGERSCVLNDPYDPSRGTSPAATRGYDLGEAIPVMPPFRNGVIHAVAGAYFQDMYWDRGLAILGGEYLDAHNGHSHGGLGYHYHMTATQGEAGQLVPAFPYILGPRYYGVTPGCGTAGTQPPDPAPSPPENSKTLTLQVSGDGSGRIEVSSLGETSAGGASIRSYPCQASLCRYTFVKGTRIQLTAQPGEGSKVKPWGGACSGKRKGECALTLRANRKVKVKFKRLQP